MIDLRSHTFDRKSNDAKALEERGRAAKPLLPSSNDVPLNEAPHAIVFPGASITDRARKLAIRILGYREEALSAEPLPIGAISLAVQPEGYLAMPLLTNPSALDKK